MANPKLTYQNGKWYRNGQVINTKTYKFYNTKTKQWSRLTNDGKVVSLNYEQKSKDATSKLTPQQRAYNYGHMDLAPTLVRSVSTVDNDKAHIWLYFPHDEGQRYYEQVTDSIKKRIASGFYDKHPEMFNRDHQMAKQYIDPHSTYGWNCINSVTGLVGKTIRNNENFKGGQYKSTYWSPQKVDKEQAIVNAPIGSVIQVGHNGSPFHAVAYMGNPQRDNKGLTWEIYNSHGLAEPFKNGNQIERVSSYDDPNYSFHPKQNDVTDIFYLK